MVRTPVRFGIHHSICFMSPHEHSTHAGDREDGTECLQLAVLRALVATMVLTSVIGL